MTTVNATGVTAGNAEQVRVGPGQILVAPYGTACPVHLVDLATLNAAWRDIGYTTGGSTVTYAQTSGDVVVAERLRAISHEITDVQMTAAFEMAQVNLENLQLATNSPPESITTDTDDSTFTWPKEGGTQRFSILWVSKDGLEMQVLVRCFGGGTITMSRVKGTTPQAIGVTFSVEENSDTAVASGRDAYNVIDNSLL